MNSALCIEKDLKLTNTLLNTIILFLSTDFGHLVYRITQGLKSAATGYQPPAAGIGMLSRGLIALMVTRSQSTMPRPRPRSNIRG